MVKYWQK